MSVPGPRGARAELFTVLLEAARQRLDALDRLLRAFGKPA
jgi:hypothetical protein